MLIGHISNNFKKKTDRIHAKCIQNITFPKISDTSENGDKKNTEKKVQLTLTQYKHEQSGVKKIVWLKYGLN